MKVCVTGGAGFIGSNFVHYWFKKYPQDKIIVLDKLTYAGGLDNLADIKNKITFVKGDIIDPKIVSRCLKQTDLVVHFAAESHNTRAETNPKIFYQTNVLGTKNLLTQALRAGVKKFIHISTDEIYGSIKQGNFKETDADKRFSFLKADYPKSKAQGDRLARDFAKKGLPVIVVRPTNNFGPYQHPEKALPRYITNILNKEKIPIWGSGQQIRDWLFVTDTCRAIDLIIHHGVIGEAYDVAANNKPEITNLAIAKLVCKLMKKNPKDWVTLVPDPRPQHDFRYRLVSQKIRDLGWQPTKNINLLFKQTITWYKTNSAWWKKRKKVAESLYRQSK